MLDHGRIIAQGSLQEVRALAGGQGTVRLRIAGDGAAAAAALRAVPGVEQVRAEEEAVVVVTHNPGETLVALIQAAQAAGARVTGAEVQEPNLETVFLHLTGRALRD
nr:MAG: hypothetical protein DIU70_14350 [Bacillota bacterium]